jgi:hypothetical protein
MTGADTIDHEAAKDAVEKLEFLFTGLHYNKVKKKARCSRSTWNWRCRQARLFLKGKQVTPGLPHRATFCWSKLLTHEVLSETIKSVEEWPKKCRELAYAWVKKAKKTISKPTLKKIYRMAKVPIDRMDAPTAAYIEMEVQKNVECSRNKIRRRRRGNRS